MTKYEFLTSISKCLSIFLCIEHELCLLRKTLNTPDICDDVSAGMKIFPQANFTLSSLIDAILMTTGNPLAYVLGQ